MKATTAIALEIDPAQLMVECDTGSDVEDVGVSPSLRASAEEAGALPDLLRRDDLNRMLIEP
jgi:hypothetical protein